jgi:hypothetical protein
MKLVGKEIEKIQLKDYLQIDIKQHLEVSVISDNQIPLRLLMDEIEEGDHSVYY